MRLSAFLEAWVQLILQEGNRVVPKMGTQVPQQGVTELKMLIKWRKRPRNSPVQTDGSG